VLLRDLARSGRMARLRIQIQDRPGALFSVVKLFEHHGVNIVEIYHQRIFTALPAKDAFIDVECEARDREHVDALIAELKQAGFNLHPVEIR
jgi:threonine dehydratase